MIILSLLIILFIKKHQKPKQKKLNQPPHPSRIFNKSSRYCHLIHSFIRNDSFIVGKSIKVRNNYVIKLQWRRQIGTKDFPSVTTMGFGFFFSQNPAMIE